MLPNALLIVNGVFDVFYSLWDSAFFCGVVIVLVSLGLFGLLASVLHIIFTGRR